MLKDTEFVSEETNLKFDIGAAFVTACLGRSITTLSRLLEFCRRENYIVKQKYVTH
jgi:hypothetical protein